MEKPKPMITPVVIPADRLQFLKKKLDDPKFSQFLKRDFIREFMGVPVLYVKNHLQK